MSCKEYIQCYEKMTRRQKDAMYDLWMKGINHDGHAWVTFGDVEYAVSILLEDMRGVNDDKKEWKPTFGGE